MTLSKNNRLREIFSQNLKYYRINKNLTQEELAEKVGLSEKYLSYLECMKYSPSLDTIQKIADILDIESYLLLKLNLNHNNVPKRLDEKTGSRKRRKS